MRKLTVVILLMFAVSLFLTGPAFGGEMKKGKIGNQRMKELVGKTTKSKMGNKLGSVDDLVIGSRGEITYLILEPGGVLDEKDELIAIPWQAVTETSYGIGGYVIVDLDKTRLETAPGYKSEEWPNIRESGWDKDIREHYKPELNRWKPETDIGGTYIPEPAQSQRK
jgi:sporulation protein YlmC with PRC-barrel domain